MNVEEYMNQDDEDEDLDDEEYDDDEDIEDDPYSFWCGACGKDINLGEGEECPHVIYQCSIFETRDVVYLSEDLKIIMQNVLKSKTGVIKPRYSEDIPLEEISEESFSDAEVLDSIISYLKKDIISLLPSFSIFFVGESSPEMGSIGDDIITVSDEDLEKLRDLAANFK